MDVAKTGPEVWGALDGEARASFEEEFRAALTRAAEDFDLAAAEAVVLRWWPVAVVTANPDPRVDEAIRRFRESGEDFSTLRPAPVLDDEARR
ncbi:DUF6247 family protein [Crossiella sp. CA-258035]|uniref:DUF6247 family protein n=1 Tax=Crossiella sp. CA-258035 TaxID=2981138 RepID=UPI0024BD1DC8|nr:DUF6247 family protein [Crossiella sp. CA-258035]WHT21238.1 DUF6247 family protein [Crossiella sp. CA-258035]